MAFVFLNFNLEIGGLTIGLLPNFLGYLLILKGLSELSGLSARFYKMTPAVLFVGTYSALAYFLETFGALGGGTAVYVFALISINLSLFVSYNIIMGIQDIEIHRGQDMNFAQLFLAWKILAVFSFLPFAAQLTPIPLVLAIVIYFVVAFYFLIILNKTRTLLYLHNPTE